MANQRSRGTSRQFSIAIKQGVTDVTCRAGNRNFYGVIAHSKNGVETLRSVLGTSWARWDEGGRALEGVLLRISVSRVLQQRVGRRALLFRGSKARCETLFLICLFRKCFNK